MVCFLRLTRIASWEAQHAHQTSFLPPKGIVGFYLLIICDSCVVDCWHHALYCVCVCVRVSVCTCACVCVCVCVLVSASIEETGKKEEYKSLPTYQHLGSLWEESFHQICPSDQE